MQQDATPSPSATSSASASRPPVRQYDVRDFFRKPERSGFQIAPGGRHVSFLARHEGRMNVFVQAIGADGTPGGEVRRLTDETERDIGGYFWKGDARILYAKDFGGDENFHVFSVPVEGGTGGALDLTPHENVRASIVDALEDDDAHVLLAHNQRDATVFDVLRVDVATGAATVIAENPGNIMGWMTDHDGRLRAAVASDGTNSTLLYRATESEPLAPILTTDFRESVQPLFFTFDNASLYVLSNRGRDKSAIFEFDPRTATEGRLVFEHDEVDAGALHYSRKRRVLTAATATTWKTFHHFFDAWSQSVQEKLEARFPSAEVAVVDATRDESRLVVATFSDRGVGKRWLYDVATERLVELADLMPWLDAADMAEMKPIRFEARDGRAINGYLTLPVGVAVGGDGVPLNLPVVVNPHGGPWARDAWGFNPEVQWLANRGYAVLQLNFRGSVGYGRAFWEAGFRQWGLSMQDDITDGVQWLIDKHIADPGRIAIYGASYGGYATLAGITLTPDLYAAAVDYVGVSNLFTLLESFPPYWKPMLDMMYQMVGNPGIEAEAAVMRAVSPLFLADRITTPLFVAQGANDPRVKQAESDQIVDTLRARGVEVEYMLKADEGHGFQKEENRFEFYLAMERFLNQHVGSADRAGA